ncbi:MAG: hypothetical protein ABWZ40_08280 [Caulobacterales bacterium]
MISLNDLTARLKANWRTLALAGVGLIVLFNVTSCILKAGGPKYSVSMLVHPSPFHGINNLALGPSGELYAASAFGGGIYKNPGAGWKSKKFIALEDGANDIAVAPNGAIAWTQTFKGRVYIRDANGATRLLLKNFAGAHSVAFAPDGTLYVSQNGAADALWQIDPAGVAPLRRVADNIGELRGFIFGPDGFIYGALAEAKSFAKIDPKTGEVLQSVAGYAEPMAIVLAPDGVFYGVDGGDGALDRIEMATSTSSRYVWLPQGVNDLVIDGRGIAYAALPSEDAILKIDMKTRAISNLVAGKLGAPGDVNLMRSDEGDVLGVTDQYAFRTVELNSGEVKDWLRLYSSSLSGAAGIGSGRRWALIASPLTGTVSVADRITHKITATLRGFSMPTDALETDDGRFVVLDSSVGELSLASAPDGVERRTIARGLKNPTAMASDGRGGVYVTETGLGRVVRIDLANGELTPVIDGLDMPEGIDTGPDGRIFVAEAGAGRVSAIDALTGKKQVVAEKLALRPAGDNRLGSVLTSGLAIGQDGAIYVTSSQGNGIYKLMPTP